MQKPRNESLPGSRQRCYHLNELTAKVRSSLIRPLSWVAVAGSSTGCLPRPMQSPFRGARRTGKPDMRCFLRRVQHLKSPVGTGSLVATADGYQPRHYTKRCIADAAKRPGDRNDAASGSSYMDRESEPRRHRGFLLGDASSSTTQPSTRRQVNPCVAGVEPALGTSAYRRPASSLGLARGQRIARA